MAARLTLLIEPLPLQERHDLWRLPGEQRTPAVMRVIEGEPGT